MKAPIIIPHRLKHEPTGFFIANINWKAEDYLTLSCQVLGDFHVHLDASELRNFADNDDVWVYVRRVRINGKPRACLAGLFNKN